MRLYTLLFVVFTSTFIVTACAATNEDLTTVDDDMDKHVKKYLIEVRETTLEYQEDFTTDPETALENFNERSEQFIEYLEGEAKEQLHKAQNYLEEYEVSDDEETRQYFTTYKVIAETYIQLLETNNQFNVDLLQDNVSDADVATYEEQMTKLEDEINKEVDKLDALMKQYKKEYDIDLVGPVL